MATSLPHPATPSGVRWLVHRFGLRPRRRLGQHFLVDRNVAGRIARAAELSPGEGVLEVGSGLGALTLALVEAGGWVLAVERDPALAQALHWLLSEGYRPPLWGRRVWLVVADVLQMDLSRLLAGPPRPQVVAANLPYVITSPFLLRLARAAGWRRAVLMVQREVAQRLAAAPGTGAYGSLSVAAQARLQVEVLFGVPRQCFWPVPEVDSAVVRLQPDSRRPRGELDEALELVLRAAFGQRRKTLRNALASLSAGPGVGPAPQQVERWLGQAGLDGGARAEELEPAAFVRLARAWLELQGDRLSS